MSVLSGGCAELSRRGFIGVAGGMAALSVPAVRAAAAVPALKIGVLSDIHVSSPKDADIFEKALRRYRAEGVDGVLIAGDLGTDGRIAELEAVAATWFKVFPDDHGEDGRRVERLFLLGNHDVCGLCYRLPELKDRLDSQELKDEWFCLDRARHWERLFHERYEPIFLKEVKGYRFVLRNWISERHGDRDELPGFLAAHGDRLKGDRPFFFAQHPHPKGTCCQSWTDGGVPWMDCSDDGRSTRLLSAYPNCIALSGHSHTTLTDEHSIWQGDFTSIGCGCLRGYAFTFPGRENGHAHDDFRQTTPRPQTMTWLGFTESKQGMLMEVHGDRIVLHRHEFRRDRPLGDDWIVPLPAPGARPYAFASRRKAAAAHPPQFGADAQVTVTERRMHDRARVLQDMVRVDFPAIPSRGGALRAFEFAVRAETRVGDCVRTLVEKRVYSPGMLLPEEFDCDGAFCTFAKAELPLGRDVRFVVTPLDCWGNGGAPLASGWRRCKQPSTPAKSFAP